MIFVRLVRKLFAFKFQNLETKTWRYEHKHQWDPFPMLMGQWDWYCVGCDTWSSDLKERK